MENMKKLYEKVAADSTLQAKFEVIMNAAEKAGQEVTEEKLVTFAKEAGYDVTLKEMQEFFKDMSEAGNAELSAQELDMVAGGKAGVMPVLSSVLSVGITCATGSLAFVIGGHKCKEYYEHQGM